MAKQTKEDLVRLVENQSVRLASLELKDTKLRTEISKCFGLFLGDEYRFRTTNTVQVLSWEQIIFKMGELSAENKKLSLNEEMVRFNETMKEFYQRIEKLENNETHKS